MNESSLTSLLNRRKRTNSIILILIAVVALGILIIHILLFFTHRSIDDINQKITETSDKIATINSNKDFTQYKRNKIFLAEHSAINYSGYFQAVFDALGTGASLKSIQTQVKSDDPSAKNVSFLISAESAPSFIDVKTLISSFKSYKQFSSPDFSSISYTRNDQGKDIFSFPITLSLNTNYANTNSK
ncbi:MAG: hypothetical protein ACK4NC_05125 [Candidatus Gracilibacteria bacterium]